MKVLISFCNAPSTPSRSNLLLVDILSGYKKYIDIGINNNGITGITCDLDCVYVLSLSDDANRLVVLRKDTLEVLLTEILHHLKDPHSLAVDGSNLYIVSSGTDQILHYRYDKDKGRIHFEGPIWSPSNSNQNSDTHHMNSVFLHRGDLYLSAFGLKKNERWSSATEGFIKNVTKDKLVFTDIYHPHSVFINKDYIYYCESSSKSVKMDGNTIIQLDSGYTRGLCLRNRYLLLGVSSGRKNSKSTNLVNNPADPGELLEDCRLLVYKKSHFFGGYKLKMTFDFLQDHKEIYDVLVAG